MSNRQVVDIEYIDRAGLMNGRVVDMSNISSIVRAGLMNCTSGFRYNYRLAGLSNKGVTRGGAGRTAPGAGLRGRQ